MSAVAELSQQQLTTIELAYGLRQGRSLLDVGCGDGSWVKSLQNRGADARGLDDAHEGAIEQSGISRVSVAANIDIPIHCCDVVLVRGTKALRATTDSPEVTIALANVLSTIKPEGVLLLALPEQHAELLASWNHRLQPFALTGKVQKLGSGLMSWLTLAPLLRPNGAVTVLEYRLGPESLNRVAWHRLARTALLPPKQVQAPAAA
ncbi:MAG: methionine biosynthesis protein MetW [Planctomycetaceae bacterium]